MTPHDPDAGDAAQRTTRDRDDDRDELGLDDAPEHDDTDFDAAEAEEARDEEERERREGRSALIGLVSLVVVIALTALGVTLAIGHQDDPPADPAVVREAPAPPAGP